MSDVEVVVLLLIVIMVWEMLFDCFNVDLDKFDNILVIGGVGGVGFIVI